VVAVYAADKNNEQTRGNFLPYISMMAPFTGLNIVPMINSYKLRTDKIYATFFESI